MFPNRVLQFETVFIFSSFSLWYIFVPSGKHKYGIEWSIRRELSKTNYLIHTDSIKEYIVPILTEEQKKYIYANEADVINVALFGMTAKEWKEKNPNLIGNMRDYTDIVHLVVLSNLENINADMISDEISQDKRIEKLNNIARKQMELLQNNRTLNNLKYIEKND